MATGKVYIITGASRGIGLELVRQILEKDSTGFVIGTARDEIKARYVFESIKRDVGNRLQIIKLDTTNEASIKDSVEQVSRIFPGGIDVLINNAGVMEREPSDLEMKASTLETTFRTNVVGAVLVTQHFLPLLRQRSTRIIANMSSQLGITGSRIPIWTGTLAYCASKASLNMVTATWAKALGSEDFTVVSLCPSWVKTDMGGEEGMLTVEQSVSGLVTVLFRLKREDSGTFIRTDGERLPWGVTKRAKL